MTEKRLLLKLISLRYIVPLAIASLASFSFPIQAQVSRQQNQLVSQLKLPDNGAPIGRRRGRFSFFKMANWAWRSALALVDPLFSSWYN